jgi:pilus assembly protein Flp/PilA
VNTLIGSVARFLADENGAQVVEYALIVAVVSIALALALGGNSGIASQFGAFVTRVAGCFTTSSC